MAYYSVFFFCDSESDVLPHIYMWLHETLIAVYFQLDLSWTELIIFFVCCRTVQNFECIPVQVLVINDDLFTWWHSNWNCRYNLEERYKFMAFRLGSTIIHNLILGKTLGSFNLMKIQVINWSIQNSIYLIMSYGNLCHFFLR
jgi:hypothetical protein